MWQTGLKRRCSVCAARPACHARSRGRSSSDGARCSVFYFKAKSPPDSRTPGGGLGPCRAIRRGRTYRPAQIQAKLMPFDGWNCMTSFGGTPRKSAVEASKHTRKACHRRSRVRAFNGDSASWFLSGVPGERGVIALNPGCRGGRTAESQHLDKTLMAQ